MKLLWSTAVSSTVLAGCLLLTALAAQAQTLVVPLGQQAGPTAAALPQRGLSSVSVKQRHGEPLGRHVAVGKPPISRWDYADFSVYFEHDHVIHSVQQHHRLAN